MALTRLGEQSVQARSDKPSTATENGTRGKRATDKSMTKLHGPLLVARQGVPESPASPAGASQWQSVKFPAKTQKEARTPWAPSVALRLRR